ncbi:MAG: TetR/AcrR family transcriptional regulator [Pseudomonadota bacterium]
MNDIKKIGRPRTFDYEVALTEALTVFWEKGYDGASIRDLTQAMGITGPSLYAAFGDKRELYLKAIDRYTDAENCEPIIKFETEEDIEQAVKQFFEAIIGYATEHESGARGCFLASSASTNIGQVEGVRERVQQSIVDTEKRLTARFDRAIKEGKLPADFPSRARARMMFDLRQGYIFRGRVGSSAKELRKTLNDYVQAVIRT